MTDTNIKFYSVNFYVNDLLASVAFYERMGFKVENPGFLYEENKVHMKLSNSEFRILLIQSIPEFAAEQLSWVELHQKEDEIGDICICYDNVFMQLHDRGLDYNLHTEETAMGFCQTGIIKDPDGFEWHVV